MRKINLYAIVLGFIFIIMLFPTHSMATKEDLQTPSERGELGNGYSANEIRKACEYMDDNGDGHISVEELQEKIDSGEDIDKYLTILRVYADDRQNKAEDAYIHYLYKVEGEGSNRKVVKNPELIELLRETHNQRRKQEGLSELNNTHIDEEMDMAKYYAPDKQTSTSSSSSIDDAINDAKDFVNQAEDDIGIVEESSLQKFSNSFYNIFLTVGTAIAVIVGIVIGIKYMLGSIEEKADIKQMLIPYAVGCIVVFGSFGIWKMIIEIMDNIL